MAPTELNGIARIAEDLGEGGGRRSFERRTQRDNPRRHDTNSAPFADAANGPCEITGSSPVPRAVFDVTMISATNERDSLKEANGRSVASTPADDPSLDDLLALIISPR